MGAAESLLDTGVLVGYLDKSDQWHSFAVEALGGVSFPAYTCEAVLSEAAYLLRDSVRGRAALWEMVDSGAVEVLPVFPAGRAYIRAAAARYGMGADLADLALLWLAEARPSVRVVTTDRRDFSCYRLAGRRVLDLVTP